MDAELFVGRGDALAVLERVRRAAGGGVPQRVLVEGAAGVGKTALVHRFLDDVGAVLYASGEEAESGLAFGVVEQLLGGRAGRAWTDPVEAGAALLEAIDEAQSAADRAAGQRGAGERASGERAGGGRAAGERGRGSWGEGELAMGERGGGGRAAGERGRGSRGEGELATGDREAGGRGVVALVVDDAQWADPASLTAFAFAVRRLRADRVVAVTVARDAQQAGVPAGVRRLFTSAGAVRIGLDGLGPDELRSLAARVGGVRLTARAAARLHAHTSGNPLHALALLDQEGRTLIEALERPDVTPPAPKSFTALVLSRLSTCDAATEALVSAASVLGSHGSFAAAETLAFGGTGPDGGEAGEDLAPSGRGADGGMAGKGPASNGQGADGTCPDRGAGNCATSHDEHAPGNGPPPPTDLALHALEAAAAAGLLTAPPATGTFRFPHPLVHAAAYHRLGPARRASLHRAAANLTDDRAAALRHRALAAPGTDEPLAAELATVGREFAARGAWSGATRQLADAARLTARRALRERYTLESVEAGLLAGDVPDVAEAAARIGEFEPSAWRSYLLGRLFLFDIGRSRALLTDAWQRCDPGRDPVLGARIAAQFAALYGSTARGAEMAEWAELALRLAPADTATDMIRYLRLSGLALGGRAEQALDGLGPLPDPAVASPAQLEELLGRGTLREIRGDLTGAVRDLTGVHAAARTRAASFRVVAATALASAEHRIGAWDDALAHADQALGLAADTDQPHIALYCRMIAGQLHSARGAFGRAEAHARVVAEYARQGHTNPVLWAALAQAQLARARGRPEEVVLALEPLPALARRGDIEEPGLTPWRDVLADAWSALGESERAAEALAPYEVLAVQRGHHGALLRAARARGTLEAARGDTAAADRAHRAALKHAPYVEAPFDRALAHLAYGAFLRRTGKRTRAAEQLTRARELLDRLGAGPDLARCARELAACGLDPAGPRERTGGGAALLTPQELAVARQVTSGLTNRQVARELVISVKTVEYHLGRIYAKLGVDSRTRLAARLDGSDPLRAARSGADRGNP
ncbi:LuxR C-terminal-related transcriptional regulator [Streptomyces sp. KL116D]|uniref:helix-turn-helix transcriptional regulator n=1 Tax=Streptomyces sp. KL116D TaxID=3045152 RepID=UPI003557BA00